MHKAILDFIMWNKWARIIFYYISFAKRNLLIKEIDNTLLINKEWVENMNIPIGWFTENKKVWISGVARLKNWWEFLNAVIKSHIPFLDEIVLIDNRSIDNTKEICMELVKQYPDKIKYFYYDYDVYWAGSRWNINWNSIHSLAYYYNRSFSKTSYKYVMKIDDDNLLLQDKRTTIKSYIIKQQPNRFMNFFGINLINKNQKIWIPSLDKYSWGHWDIWIYPVSKKTYYTQWKKFELLRHPFLFKDIWLSYIHLKYLKKDLWLWNYKNTSIEESIIKKIDKSKVLPLRNFMKEDEFYKITQQYDSIFNNNMYL